MMTITDDDCHEGRSYNGADDRRRTIVKKTQTIVTAFCEIIANIGVGYVIRSDLISLNALTVLNALLNCRLRHAC